MDIYLIFNKETGQYWKSSEGWIEDRDKSTAFGEYGYQMFELPAGGEWVKVPYPPRVVVEVSGGVVCNVYGDVDSIVCDWDNINGGDVFKFPVEWADDPSVSNPVVEYASEMLGSFSGKLDECRNIDMGGFPSCYVVDSEGRSLSANGCEFVVGTPVMIVDPQHGKYGREGYVAEFLRDPDYDPDAPCCMAIAFGTEIVLAHPLDCKRPPAVSYERVPSVIRDPTRVLLRKYDKRMDECESVDLNGFCGKLSLASRIEAVESHAKMLRRGDKVVFWDKRHAMNGREGHIVAFLEDQDVHSDGISYAVHLVAVQFGHDDKLVVAWPDDCHIKNGDDPAEEDT